MRRSPSSPTHSILPKRRVETGSPRSLTAITDDRLRMALVELSEVTEALEGTVEMHVTLEAAVEHDDGPGAPGREREPAVGDRDRTRLDHGSDLGLWTVRWIVEALGGELAFDVDGAVDRDAAVATALKRRPSPPALLWTRRRRRPVSLP